ncbi:MAG: hypothetical protein A2096_10110 [Spirochaetes bacterium GWF1_41_5]|nr:MAG: hypothetical protein A2096_10110 [Spirochaetes bacterium GWF1_41_5]
MDDQVQGKAGSRYGSHSVKAVLPHPCGVEKVRKDQSGLGTGTESLVAVCNKFKSFPIEPSKERCFISK